MGGVTGFRQERREIIMNEGHDRTDQRQRLRALLVAYLLAADAPGWPGADGITVEDVLRSYSQVAADGLVPDLPTLLARHPELADALRDFFAL
jgi:hypothetical protein